MRALLIAGSLGAVCAGCTIKSPVHAGNGISVHGLVFESTDWDRSIDFVGSADFDADVSGFGVQYEGFASNSLSYIVGLEQREYSIDVPGGDSGDGWEIRTQARFYFNEDDPFQPFVNVLMMLGLGLDFGPTDSNVYFGAGVGAGLSYFINRTFAVEANVMYEAAFITTDVAGFSVDDTVTGFTGLLGVGVYF